MRFVTKTNTPICTGYFLMRFIVHNEFHESLRVGFSSGRLIRQRLRTQIHFDQTKYCPQILALILTLKLACAVL